jgi:uncharacterized membrane protein YphA (DoxX/SURF4 family)
VIATPVFFGAWAAAAAAAFVAIRRISTETAARRLAAAFLAATIALAGAGFLATLAQTLKVLPPGTLPLLVSSLLTYRMFLPLGVGTAAAALAAGPARHDALLRAFALSPRVRLALVVSIALAYFGAEIGKLTHEGEMREFFASSGLPVWLNHAVIAAEAVLAAALFAPLARVFAAVGLAGIMAGAILTHAHNGDPFSDSLEALHLLALLACLLALTRIGRAREG